MKIQSHLTSVATLTCEIFDTFLTPYDGQWIGIFASSCTSGGGWSVDVRCLRFSFHVSYHLPRFEYWIIAPHELELVGGHEIASAQQLFVHITNCVGLLLHLVVLQRTDTWATRAVRSDATLAIYTQGEVTSQLWSHYDFYVVEKHGVLWWRFESRYSNKIESIGLRKRPHYQSYIFSVWPTGAHCLGCKSGAL